MRIGDRVDVMGCVTQLGFLNGHSLLDMERLIGFQAGRLSAGATFVALQRLPTINEFETLGYSQVAEHRHRFPSDLDPVRIRQLAMSAWTATGRHSLLKLLAVSRHDKNLSSDIQYPPGAGIPQWKITQAIPGRVVAVLSKPNDVLRLN